MTSIHRFDRALETLRQTLAERSPTGNTPQASQQNASAAATDNRAVVRRRIKERLALLDLTQRADQERGATIFLETVLGNEFGTDLLSDPAFHDMIADVRTTMFADRDTQNDLVTMLAELKASD